MLGANDVESNKISNNVNHTVFTKSDIILFYIYLFFDKKRWVFQGIWGIPIPLDPPPEIAKRWKREIKKCHRRDEIELTSERANHPDTSR